MRRTVSERISVFLSTWFYTGLIPPIIFRKMSGTYGSFFSLPACFLALYMTSGIFYPWFVYLAYTSLILALGLMFVPYAEKALGPRTDYKGRIKYHDQNEIVIDEVFGMMITCFPLVFMEIELVSWDMALMLLLAFAYFRLFDIVKIPPTRFFDRMRNSFGVMMDDGVAAVYAGLCLVATRHLLF